MLTTTRYGFPQIQLTDNVDIVVDFNNPWAKVDTLLGTQVCTSTTRPSSPVQGQLIFETDTGLTRKYTGSAWQTVGNAISLSGSRPANPIQGDELYETDTGAQRVYTGSAWGGILPVKTSGSLAANPIAGDLSYLSDIGALAYYSGGAWHTCTLIVCTSTTRPTGSSLQTGTFIYETDTTRLLVYTGSTWAQKTFSNFVCTSTTHPSSPFTGLEIYETDTGLNGVYNGSGYLYGIQQIAATQVLGGSAASVTFSSIPAVNKLRLVWRVKGTSTAGDLEMNIDNVSTSTYQSAKIQGRTAAVSLVTTATTYAPIGVVPSSSTASYFGSGATDIQGWNNASSFLTYSGVSASFDSTSSYWTEVYNGQYLAAGPHTSLKLTPAAGSFASGSEFSLYACP